MANKKTKVDFLTSGYVVAHGHTPRGFGSWAFQVRGSADVVWFNQMTYTDAKRKMTDCVRSQCSTDVHSVDVEVLS